MKISRLLKTCLGALLSLALVACTTPKVEDSEPVLPSWNAGSSRDSIIDFVEAVTDPASPDFVPGPARIAVFDNDGTLWSERPVYFQIYYMLDRLEAMSADHPEWREEQPFKAALERDMATLQQWGEDGLGELFAVTHTGMTQAEFTRSVNDWVATARHPDSGKPFTEMIYQPMLELLDYLRANGFQTWIVSGGGINFMRPWTESVYGIPPQQVVGTSFKTSYQQNGANQVIMREPELSHWNDKAGKPVGIERHIGRRPIFAGGNSDGDYQMLRYTTDAPGRQFGLIVHHTDAAREWAYDRESAIGRLDKGLDDAAANGWTIVDMANDWNRVYPE